MTLDRFFAESGWTEERLASEAGADQSMINRLRTGARKASLPLALRIEKATSGKVRAEEIPMKRASRAALSGLRAAGATMAHGSAA